jgi:hypothetical protein
MRQRQSDPEADAGLEQDGHRVRADAEERGMSQALLAGVADGEVQAHRRDDEHIQ